MSEEQTLIAGWSNQGKLFKGDGILKKKKKRRLRTVLRIGENCVNRSLRKKCKISLRTMTRLG